MRCLEPIFPGGARGGRFETLQLGVSAIPQISSWVWVKSKPPKDGRFWSMVPLTRVPLWVPIFDPQPVEGLCYFPKKTRLMSPSGDESTQVAAPFSSEVVSFRGSVGKHAEPVLDTFPGGVLLPFFWGGFPY